MKPTIKLPILVLSILFTFAAAKRTDIQKTVAEQIVTTSDSVAIQKAIAEIRNFYVAYTANLLSDNSFPDPLIKKHLAKSLIEKTSRMRTATGADPIIRAQDVQQDIIETLNARHLDKNWYMASYTCDYSHTNIPLRITQINGQYLIDYITPIWNGSSYGDSLLFDHPVPETIDASAPLSLLETFYAAYMMEYCSMPEDLVLRLVALREKHLTTNALSQFKAAANKYKLDGSMGYDLLIDYFDFDRLWLSSVKFIQLDENTYQICYTKWETPCTIELKVIKQGKEYRIDSISEKGIMAGQRQINTQNNML